MSEKNKKILYGTLIGLDIVLTIFLFVISIIMLATMPKDKEGLDAATGMIGYLQQNPTVFLVTCVVPLFLLLGGNIAFLMWYVKKANKKAPVELNDLSKEQMEALQQSLMDQMNSSKENEEKK